MGMLIDELMEDIHAIQAYYNDETKDSYIGFSKEDNESVDMAISIIRKYQKIEQIIKKHDNDRIPEDYWYIDKIREVIEDKTKTN